MIGVGPRAHAALIIDVLADEHPLARRMHPGLASDNPATRGSTSPCARIVRPRARDNTAHTTAPHVWHRRLAPGTRRSIAELSRS
jgi:hypothetical protein